MDLKRLLWIPTLTSAEVAGALQISKNEFHNLRNAGAGADLQIQATAGTSTRDQRWSVGDALRLGVVYCLEDSTPAERRGLWDILNRASIESAADDKPIWAAMWPAEQGGWVGPEPGLLKALKTYGGAYFAARLVNVTLVITYYEDLLGMMPPTEDFEE